MKTIEQLGVSPAPWKADIGVYSFWVDDNAEKSVCMENSTCKNDRDIGRRNARLIAAAPELYEALRLWVEELCEDCQAEIGKTCDGKCEAVRRAVAALEKAGGEK